MWGAQRGGDDGGRGFYQDFYGKEATTLPCLSVVMTRAIRGMRWNGHAVDLSRRWDSHAKQYWSG